MKDRSNEYEENLDVQFGYWNAQIGMLKAKADKARTDAKVEYHYTIETFLNAMSKFK